MKFQLKIWKNNGKSHPCHHLRTQNSKIRMYNKSILRHGSLTTMGNSISYKIEESKIAIQGKTVWSEEVQIGCWNSQILKGFSLF